MNNKLEVGMYCYNKTNRKMGIGKIISFQSNNNINVKYKKDIELVSIGNLEASDYITELICVGDYVNGYLVIEKDINNELRYIDLKDRNMKYVKYLDIKSIVTKETFESMEYKIDDKKVVGETR